MTVQPVRKTGDSISLAVLPCTSAKAVYADSFAVLGFILLRASWLRSSTLSLFLCPRGRMVVMPGRHRDSAPGRPGFVPRRRYLLDGGALDVQGSDLAIPGLAQRTVSLVRGSTRSLLLKTQGFDGRQAANIATSMSTNTLILIHMSTPTMRSSTSHEHDHVHEHEHEHQACARTFPHRPSSTTRTRAQGKARPAHHPHNPEELEAHDHPHKA